MTLFWKVQNVLILQEAYNCVHSVELIHIYIKAFVYFCWKVFLWSESDFFKILVVQCCILFLWHFFHKRLCFCKDIFIKIRKVCNVKLENEQKKKTTVKYLIRQSTWKTCFTCSLFKVLRTTREVIDICQKTILDSLHFLHFKFYF